MPTTEKKLTFSMCIYIYKYGILYILKRQHIYIDTDVDIYIFIYRYINKYIDISISISIYAYVHMYIYCIYDAISNEKRKQENFSLI
jgi:hypothetical protein